MAMLQAGEAVAHLNLARHATNMFTGILYSQRVGFPADQATDGKFPDENKLPPDTILFHDVGLGGHGGQSDVETRSLLKIHPGSRLQPVVQVLSNSIVTAVLHSTSEDNKNHVNGRLANYTSLEVAATLSTLMSESTLNGRIARSITAEFTLTLEAFRFVHMHATYVLNKYFREDMLIPRVRADMDMYDHQGFIPVPDGLLTSIARPVLFHIIACHLSFQDVDKDAFADLLRAVEALPDRHCDFPTADSDDPFFAPSMCTNRDGRRNGSARRVRAFTDDFYKEYVLQFQQDCAMKAHGNRITAPQAAAIVTYLSSSFSGHTGIALQSMCSLLSYIDCQYIIDFLGGVTCEDRMFKECNPVLNAVLGLFVGTHGHPISISKCMSMISPDPSRPCAFSTSCHVYSDCGCSTSDAMHMASHLPDVGGVHLLSTTDLIKDLLSASKACPAHPDIARPNLPNGVSQVEQVLLEQIRCARSVTVALDILALPGDIAGLIVGYLGAMVAPTVRAYKQDVRIHDNGVDDKYCPWDLAVMPDLMATVAYLMTWMDWPFAVHALKQVAKGVCELRSNRGNPAARQRGLQAVHDSIDVHTNSYDGVGVITRSDMVYRGGALVFSMALLFAELQHIRINGVFQGFIETGSNLSDAMTHPDDHFDTVYYEEMYDGELTVVKTSMPAMCSRDILNAVLHHRALVQEEKQAAIELAADDYEEPVGPDAHVVDTDADTEPDDSEGDVDEPPLRRRRIDIGDLE